MTYTLESLCKQYRQGKKPRFAFFWKPESGGRVGPGCLSQWQTAPFVVNGQRYVSAEHFMMAEKARLFQDESALRDILAAGSPPQIKQLGRAVRNFDEAVWADRREDIVYRGNMAKFDQNPSLKAFLLETGNKVLAEASPHDRIWGIGLDESAKAAKNPLLWKGLNLLGFCLMRVRDRALAP